MPWVSLCTLDELTEGKAKSVEIDGYRLAVFLNGDQISAIDSVCPHAGADLANGFVEDGCAVCPWHYWAFRLDNGQMRDTPGVAVGWYPTRIYPFNGKQLVQADLPRV
jgi:nitrite reductase/ring-hydroxylating ferredoxin subunit